MINKVTKPASDSGISLQSIQDFLNHVLRIKSDVSAPIIISLLIFIVGFLINALVRNIITYNQRSTIRKMFILNLTAMIADLNKQCQNFDELVKQLIFKDSNNFILKDTHLFQIILLQEIGYKKSYKAFFTGFENVIFKCFKKTKRINAFLSIWESIEFVKKWQNKPQDDSKEFVKYYNANNQKRNKALSDYMQIMEPFLLEAPHKIDLSDALKYYATEIDSIRLNWQKTPNRINPFKVHRKLVLPVRILNRKLDDVQVVYRTTRPLLEASQAYAEMAAALKVYREIFKDYSTAFGNRAINIGAAIKVI